MNGVFDGYSRINKEKLKELVLKANIAFDTSSLFGLYRSKESTSDQVLAYLEKSKDRVFLPFTVGLEYHANRTSVLNQQRHIYSKIKKKVEDLALSIDDFFVREEHINVDYYSINTMVKSFSEKIEKYLKKAEESHPNYLINDPIRDRLTSIFSQRTGDKPTDKYLEQAYQEGERRYNHKIPPGFKDAKNKEHEFRLHGDTIFLNKYADFLIWKEIISLGLKTQNDTLLITDEKKTDWILEENGYIIGPRPELITEYREATQKRFHILNVHNFFELLQEFDVNAISRNTIKDLKKVARSSWKEEVYNAFVALGGRVSLDKLYEYIEKNTDRSLTANWRGTARKSIYYYCEDRDLFLGKEKLYREVDSATYELIEQCE